MKIFLVYSLTFLLFAISYSLTAQELAMVQTETKLSKGSVKGHYAGTYLTSDGGPVALYLYASKKKGILYDAYDFEKDAKFSGVQESFSDLGTLANLKIEPPDNEPSNFQTYSDVIIIRTDLLSRMVVDKGYIKPSYDYAFSPPFFTGYEFESEEKLKPETRIYPMAFITIGETMKDIQLEGGIKQVISGTGQETVLMGDAAAQVIGIVREKISIGNPSPYNNNRLAVQMISGEDLGSVLQENFYELPFASTLVDVAKIGEDATLLLSTLQAPTSVKPSSQLNMKGENRRQLIYVRVDDVGDLVDSINYRPKSVRGMFKMFPRNDEMYVLGLVNGGHDGYFRWDAGKITDFQITKISDGKIAFNKSVTIEDLESNMTVPKDEKVKFGIDSKAAREQFLFTEMVELSNGDLFAFGKSLKQYFGFQFSTEGDLKRYYQFNRIDDDYFQYDVQLMDHKGDLLIVIMEQPADVTQGTHYSSTRRSRSVVRIDDVFTKGQIVKLDPNSMSLSNQVDIGGKKFLMLGSDPCGLMDKNGEIFITGTDRKKALYMISLR